ncbi:DsbA family protein [Marivirga sp. S37H4]|uniref:DsbA family protein n=1 Tax=Marivirga aurantiaca TaxID=2802615 RepID=A0A935CAN0_9BACT|nr:DsbA family protein [Marivirga aurantiaca]MBK6266861.1 DsbA family protein [Marivirga aurantiaca]
MRKIKLLYFYDPLCGWCFGFSPIIKALEQKYAPEISFEAISGGMILGERIKPLREMHAYLRDAMPRLEKMTGVKFGEDYMKVFEKGDIELNSETPCMAMTVYKSISSGSSIEFASALQNELYVYGKDLNIPENYKGLVEKFNLDWDVFSKKMKSDTYKKKTYEEFEFAQRMGINGFPSVVLQIEDQGYLIARGYRAESEMKKVIDEIIKKEKAD